VAESTSIRTGTIIWAEVNDPVTHAPAGKHPAIVLNPQCEIDAGQDLDVYVCTTNTGNRQSGWFDVPTKPGGHETTGLDQACVVKATWHNVIPQSQVIKIVGRAPASLFKQIRNWLADKARNLPKPQ
jgi:mRNA-degrading endonuclease toxin of MazEF toxin-antitoxin module